MSYIVQQIRSTEEGKRPRPAQLAEGQFALNVHDASPGVFLKTTEDKVVKVGGVAVGPTTPFAVFNNEYSVGELWYNTETKLLNIYTGAEWVPTYSDSQATAAGVDLDSRVTALELTVSTDSERAAGDAVILSDAKAYVDNFVSTLQEQINLKANTVDTDITAAAVLELDDTSQALVTLSGMPSDSQDLGTFGGSTLADNLSVKGALQALETAVDAVSPLSNIVDGAQGVEVTGRVAAEGLDLSVGGQITAAGCSIDFQSATISFSGASISGLSGEIRDNVDLHLNQSTATDGQILSWDASANAGNGDYAWIAAPAGSGGASASDVAALVSLSGVAAGDTDLGTFISGIIPDNSTIKEALQSVETDSLSRYNLLVSSIGTKASTTFAEGLETNIDNLVALTGVAKDATDLGDFSGTTITSASDIKTALQELETAVESAGGGAETDTLDSVTGRGATTTNDITVGKCYFKNVFNASGDLPSATTHHGMFAHVHGEGAAYFAHSGSWVKLANHSELGTATASNFTFNASLIPDTNAQYDLGSAEYKVRHLFLSDNSIKFGDAEIPLSVNEGDLEFGGIPVMPRTLNHVLQTLGVASYADNGAALGAGLIVGDVYYDTTLSKLTSVTA